MPVLETAMRRQSYSLYDAVTDAYAVVLSYFERFSNRTTRCFGACVGPDLVEVVEGAILWCLGFQESWLELNANRETRGDSNSDMTATKTSTHFNQYKKKMRCVVCVCVFNNAKSSMQAVCRSFCSQRDAEHRATKHTQSPTQAEKWQRQRLHVTSRIKDNTSNKILQFSI